MLRALSPLMIATFATQSFGEGAALTANSVVENSEIGVLATGLTLSPVNIDDLGESISFEGQLATPDGQSISILVNAPATYEDVVIAEEGGSLETDIGEVEYSLVSSEVIFERPLITSTIYSMERAADISDRGIVSMLDDPHPLIVPALIGASYILICGGLEIYSARQECPNDRRLVIGVEYQGMSFGCTIECTARANP